ncbi:MAG TPA: spermidine/putrescine ABC transporter substrate-binding protein [Bryobacteraceae bacterium]|nr:spermidine/putrescine ABC transporter substrate-binding protein [Bryobacteraceae bacterium]
MNRRTFLIGAATAAACSRGPRLNVFNWSDYVAPDTVANFEREFGIRVRYGTYESVPEMLAKVMTGNSGWDVIFPSAEYIQPMRDMGLLARLNHDWLPNLSNLDGQFQQPQWDPRLEWCVPYMHGSTGIVYQRSLVSQQGWTPRAWSDLWDARLAGKLTMLDDPPEVFAACLKTLGYSLNSSDPSQLKAAQQRAIAQKPLVRAYLNAEVRDQLVAGDVAAAQAWAVTAAQAISAAPDKLAFAFPSDGFPRYADNVAILRESGRQEAAHQFINYLLRPQVAAAIVETTRTAACNGAAQRYLPKALRSDPVLYPPAEILARGEWFTPQSAAGQRLRDRLWTEIKT